MARVGLGYGQPSSGVGVRGATMGDRVPVRIGDVVFEVEVAQSGPANITSLADALSFDGVRDTIEALAGEMAKVWARVKPDEATVEFGLSLDAKTGKLTGLVLEGKAAASFKISLTWRAASQQGAGANPG